MAAFDFSITYNPDEEVVIPEGVKEAAQYLVTTMHVFLKRERYPGYWGLVICSNKDDQKNWKMSFQRSNWCNFVSDNKIKPGDTVKFEHRHGLFTVSVFTQGFEKALDPNEKMKHAIIDLPDAEGRADEMIAMTSPRSTYVKISKFKYNKATFIGLSKEFADEIMGKVKPKKDVNVKVMVGPQRYDIVLRIYMNANLRQYKVVKGWKELMEGCNLRVDDAIVFYYARGNPSCFHAALMFKID